jgi:hypothetical protein
MIFSGLSAVLSDTNSMGIIGNKTNNRILCDFFIWVYCEKTGIVLVIPVFFE